ncbi:MAG: hypothetical protein ISR82_05860 [Candidatus Marinimicrobia bacterium]|nr:hypothetical protein [Candidatus Neomarinimicrobiota bacterium]MBL7010729.1 hypothetical protein [Candidatus Neomarinimicrobiota bacterium]MBL7029896.1 hypothetical protein [Candidatus Neomarinimicrobiota bacterium]
MIKKLFVSLMICQGFIFTQESIKAEGTITYVTTDQVYSDIGLNKGAAVGDTLTVLRRGQELGLIHITSIANKSSVSESLVPISQFQLGDRVVLEKINNMILPPKKEIVSQKPKPAKPAKRSPWRQSGNISARYMSTQYSDKPTKNRSIGMVNYRLRSSGFLKPQLWVYGRSDLLSGDFNLYQARLTLGQSNGKFFMQAGRVFSPALSGLGATDGLVVSSTFKKEITLGVLGGYLPAQQNMDFSKDVLKTGGFIHYKKQTKNMRINGSAAFAQQKFKGKTDREFLYWSWRSDYKKSLSLAINQTLDLYSTQSIGDRKSLTPTSNQISIRFRPTNGLSLYSRYSGRRQVVYFESVQTLPDSLFQDELRSGWYNAFNWSSDGFGNIQIGLNLRSQISFDRPASVIVFGYQTPNKKNKRSYRFKTNFIRNDLLTGIRAVLGVDQSLNRNVSLYADADFYSYGYGNKSSDFFQSRFSGGFNWRVHKRIQFSTNIDYLKDKSYTNLFIYAGLNYRF